MKPIVGWFVFLLFLAHLAGSGARAGVPTPLNLQPAVPPNGRPCSEWLARFSAFTQNASSCFNINRVPQFQTVNVTSWCIDAENKVIYLPTMTLQCL